MRSLQEGGPLGGSQPGPRPLDAPVRRSSEVLAPGVRPDPLRLRPRGLIASLTSIGGNHFGLPSSPDTGTVRPSGKRTQPTRPAHLKADKPPCLSSRLSVDGHDLAARVGIAGERFACTGEPVHIGPVLLVERGIIDVRGPRRGPAVDKELDVVQGKSTTRHEQPNGWKDPVTSRAMPSSRRKSRSAAAAGCSWSESGPLSADPSHADARPRLRLEARTRGVAPAAPCRSVSRLRPTS